MSEQLTLFDISPEYAPPKYEWKYDEDTGSVLCRCPMCEGRLPIGEYVYCNPYKYCPYCGMKLAEGNITARRKEVYKLEQEDEGRRVTIETREKMRRGRL